MRRKRGSSSSMKTKKTGSKNYEFSLPQSDLRYKWVILQRNIRVGFLQDNGGERSPD